MLTLKIEGELYDEEREKFIPVKQTLQLEHSLISISKWESKWKIPFMREESMTRDQTIDYIRCMTVSPQNADPNAYLLISNEHVRQVMEYIHDPMTATVIHENQNKKKSSGHVITSEEVYYYMTAYQIPFEHAQKWHFNRLMTLIRICDAKNQKPQKMSKKDIMAQNRARNQARKAKHHTRG